MGRMEWLVLSVVWLVASFGTGAILARLYHRLYSGLSYYKLWAFWTVVSSLVTAAIFALGLI
jgi:uncharacterized membrane protein